MNHEEFSASQNQKLNEVLTTIDSETFDKGTLKETISGLLKAQETYGKESYTKKASQVNKYLEIFGKLGYNKEEHETPENFIEKFKGNNEAIEAKTSEYQLLEARLKKIEGEKAAETERAEALKSANEKNTIESKLSQALEPELKGAKHIVKNLISEGKVKLVDGEVVFVKGTEVVLFEEGIKGVISENEELKKVSIKPGAGSSSKSVTSPISGTISMEAINKMSPAELKANMAHIKKMAGIR